MIRKAPTWDTAELTWFKSSYSGGTNGESCVELALTPHTIHIRDSKHHTTGPQLALTPETWAEFISYASTTR
ncbi:DUF397 domain-containing protein [Streptomyces sp. YU58]|uniref:DUF397 domain-containing protein n=1 Tax=Streptomyces sp. SX92 TaxID=3158972 RepID=UPI0027B8EF95|nr:DUF397 domain-containing protein [Streptomyces coralus]WLW53842.1 DUF397 domain-containing protein [Streptomyces coralus]